VLFGARLLAGAAATYPLIYWSPFVAGAVLLVPVAVLLRR